MKILVCGDRNWVDQAAITRELLGYLRTTTPPSKPVSPNTITVIHGDARGADRLAGEVARCLGMKVKRYPADWAQYGRAAGPIRNKRMLEEGKPDLVLAFHPDLRQSRGTAHMVSIAKKAGVPVRVFNN